MNSLESIFFTSDERNQDLWNNIPKNTISYKEISQRSDENIYVRDYHNGLILHKYQLHLGNGQLMSHNSFIQLDNLILEQIRAPDLLGLRISTNFDSFEIYLQQPNFSRWFNYIKKYAIQDNFNEHYKIISLVGQGTFALVNKVQETELKGIFASKTILKKSLKTNIQAMKNLFNELKIMRSLYHENIIHLIEVFEDEQNIYLILDYFEGGNLLNAFHQSPLKFDQVTIQQIILKLLQTLEYIHSKKIIHMDIKPDNILLANQKNITDITISDFGLSIITQNVISNDLPRGGTLGYVAPEILLNQDYDNKVDIFAVGVIMFTFLTGVNPFQSVNLNKLFWKNANCDVDFSLLSNKINNKAISLVKQLLNPNRLKRLSAHQALNHEWFDLLIIEQEYVDYHMKPQPVLILKSFIHQEDQSRKSKMDKQQYFPIQEKYELNDEQNEEKQIGYSENNQNSKVDTQQNDAGSPNQLSQGSKN